MFWSSVTSTPSFCVNGLILTNIEKFVNSKNELPDEAEVLKMTNLLKKKEEERKAFL